jgi:hypothetical protein
MTRANDLVTLEESGWQALSSGGPVAREFYDGVLDDDVVMLLPGGMRLDDRALMLDAMAGQPWASHTLEDLHVLAVTDDVAVVTYGVVAQREGPPTYSALISSIYVRRGDSWRLALHQQTPR